MSRAGVRLAEISSRKNSGGGSHLSLTLELPRGLGGDRLRDQQGAEVASGLDFRQGTGNRTRDQAIVDWWRRSGQTAGVRRPVESEAGQHHGLPPHLNPG